MKPVYYYSNLWVGWSGGVGGAGIREVKMQAVTGNVYPSARYT